MADQRELVIVVDDDQAVREALQFALRLEGLCVHAHDGGVALLSDPSLGRAACVIVDHRMPRMDGFALLSDVHAGYPGLPAIMLTSHATLQLQARADAAGVWTVLEKPLLGDVLLDKIRSILRA